MGFIAITFSVYHGFMFGVLDFYVVVVWCFQGFGFFSHGFSQRSAAVLSYKLFEFGMGFLPRPWGLESQV